MNMQPTRLALLAITLPAVLALPSFAADKQQDLDITYWVENALRHDDRVPAAEVTVTTKDAVVTLEGTVENLAAKSFAKREAEKIAGVVAVMDELVVDPIWRSDTDLRHAVHRRLLSSGLVDVEGLEVACEAGVLTLKGRVPSYNEVLETGLLASEVRGVKQVNNDVHVLWKSQRSDDEIEKDAMAALDRDVYLSSMPIDVRAEHGMVTLTGSVGSAYERRRAHDDVRWIPHVKGVVNLLAVRPWKDDGVRKERATPSSEELAQHVHAALVQDSAVDATNIAAKVSFGHVTLSGSVPTRWEKKRAEEDARAVIGVAWVTNHLFARTDRREDFAVEGDISFNLETDATTEGFELEVNVKKGVATLTGSVHSWYQKAHAESVASRVRGVRDVVNQIVVLQPEWRSDAEIVKSVERRLEWNWSTLFVHKDIHVTSMGGVVELIGDVHSWAQRKQAERVALHTDGVQGVINRLTVKGVGYPWGEWYELPTPMAGPYYQIDEYDYWIVPSEPEHEALGN